MRYIYKVLVLSRYNNAECDPNGITIMWKNPRIEKKFI